MTIQLHDGCLQVFAVDHGQCALLTMPSPGRTQRVLIDCGHSVDFQGGPWYPSQHLRSLGINFVDMLICTNFDEDHMSGFPNLDSQGITVGCILGNPTVTPRIIAKLKNEDGMGRGIQALVDTLAARQQIGWAQVPPTISGMALTWSWNPYPRFEDENNLSLIATLNIRGFRFMFPGDMERAGFDHLLSTCPSFRQTVGNVDVLIASHHGRQNGICPDMFEVYGCRPKLVVISDDYKQYNSQETTNYYGSKTSGITGFRGQGLRKVLTTRRDGEIRFSFQNGNCTVG